MAGVIAYESGDDGEGNMTPCVRARMFEADGTPAGADFIVNSTATWLQAQVRGG